MNKSLILLLLISVSLTLTGCGKQGVATDQQVKPAIAKKRSADYSQMSSRENVADKVQVFLFHPTQRCSTCIAIGKLAGETVNERFQAELKSGKIEFREVNIDLPENKALATKFQASGSALYLNAISGDTDRIEQDAKVWRLTQDPVVFKEYLEGRINILLGK